MGNLKTIPFPVDLLFQMQDNLPKTAKESESRFLRNKKKTELCSLLTRIFPRGLRPVEHPPDLGPLEDLRVADVGGDLVVDAEDGHLGLDPGEDGGGGAGAVRHLEVRVVRLGQSRRGELLPLELRLLAPPSRLLPLVYPRHRHRLAGR